MGNEDVQGQHYEELHLPQLRELAQSRGIDPEGQMHKAQLIEALRGARGGGAPGGTGRAREPEPGPDSAATPAPGPAAEDAMPRSEERLRVGTETREAGTARLEKRLVTEPVTASIEVEREQVEVVREPVTDANREAAYAGPELTEAEHEVTLHEQVPVVEKEVVPTERVRLETSTVREQADVSAELRHEEIDVVAPGEVAGQG